jgi:hypothetical protein
MADQDIAGFLREFAQSAQNNISASGNLDFRIILRRKPGHLLHKDPHILAALHYGSPQAKQPGFALRRQFCMILETVGNPEQQVGDGDNIAQGRGQLFNGERERSAHLAKHIIVQRTGHNV